MNDDFATVDEGDTARLVMMMRATDAWPVVHAVRSWVLDRAAPRPGGIVVDGGCGPGTFGALAAQHGPLTVDLDRSLAMLGAARATHATSRGVCGHVDRLPFRLGAASLTRAERVLQWTANPDAALAELVRITSRDGWIAVTDTDWGAFRIAHRHAGAAAPWSDAALGWVPHPRVAATIPDRLGALGCRDLETRRDVVTITEWDPDDPGHGDGPPGLPLRSIAGGAPPESRVALLADLGRLADEARRGRFGAELTLVTVVARVPARRRDNRQKSVR